MHTVARNLGPIMMPYPLPLDTNAEVCIGFGYMFSFAFFGILVVQTYIYQTRFFNDHKAVKIFVWIIQLMETLSCVLTLFSFRDGIAASCLLCVIIPIFPETSDTPTWAFLPLSILTGLISSMVHGFFCWRIWVISRSLFVPIVVMMISLFQCTMVIYGASMILQTSIYFRTFTGSPSEETSTPLGGSPASWDDYLWLGGSFVCDFIITAQTIRLLFQRRSATQFEKTKSLLLKLIMLTIETGMVTALGSLVELIMAVQLPQYYHLVIFYSLSKLYANCMMASLNSRLVISSGEANKHQVAPALFKAHTNNGFSPSQIRHKDRIPHRLVGARTPSLDSDLEMGSYSGCSGVGSLNPEDHHDNVNAGSRSSSTMLIKALPPILSISPTWAPSASLENE